MELKMFLLLVVAAVAAALPAKIPRSADLSVAEGQHIPTYSASYGYASPRHGGATVTSYNRRGSHAHASNYAKPSIYGTSYGAHPAAYGAKPTTYAAPAHGYASPIAAYPSAPVVSYGGYGPQTNAYSAHSQLLSQDPSYDAAKDPVSQYAAYIPKLEYASKGQSAGNELSIYGYRK